MEKINKKVILAFSGGLDTSFCALWLKKQGFYVVTVTVDTGGFSNNDREKIDMQATKCGSSKHYFIDGKLFLYNKIVSYIIIGNILRGGVYPLCAGGERLVIAIKSVEIARKEKARFIAHGSTGAGNDQVRFDTAISVLAPNLKIITPIRTLGINRVQELKLLKLHNIPVPDKSKKYSINCGMLGITIGGGETKGSWESPPEEVFDGVTPVHKTPDKSFEFILSFKKGMPLAINGQKMTGIEIMEFLAKRGGKYGVGKNIHLGNTILGIKGRIAFAAPAITILIYAHRELEKLVQTKWQTFWKDILANAYGNFLHEGNYFDPVMRDIEAMFLSSQSYVGGDVKVKLYKGNIIIVGVRSPFSLMNSGAVYGEESAMWTGSEAAGFSKIYGLGSVLAARVHNLSKI